MNDAPPFPEKLRYYCQYLILKIDFEPEFRNSKCRVQLISSKFHFTLHVCTDIQKDVFFVQIDRLENSSTENYNTEKEVADAVKKFIEGIPDTRLGKLSIVLPDYDRFDLSKAKTDEEKRLRDIQQRLREEASRQNYSFHETEEEEEIEDSVEKVKRNTEQHSMNGDSNEASHKFGSDSQSSVEPYVKVSDDRCEVLENENKELKSQSVNIQNKLEELVKELDELRREEEEEKSKLGDQIKERDERLKSSEKENLEFINKISEKDERIKELNDKIVSFNQFKSRREKELKMYLRFWEFLVDVNDSFYYQNEEVFHSIEEQIQSLMSSSGSRRMKRSRAGHSGIEKTGLKQHEK